MSAIAEKYAKAISSSHLEWRIEPGAIDVLTAAGLVEDTLGTCLLRLRAEFDSISTMPGARHMMPRLKSAGAVQRRLVALIIQRAKQPIDAHEIAAKLLDHWLSPQCPSCTGRGEIGEYGKPRCICPACSGSKRRTLFWKHDEQAFADMIGAEMESKVDSAGRRIRKLLQY